MNSIIKQLPAWVRFESYDPLKPYAHQISNPADIKARQKLMRQLQHLPEMSQAIRRAHRLAQAETRARAAFKGIYKTAPKRLLEMFPPETYRDPAQRRAFERELLKPQPKPVGFNDVAEFYRPNRQMFKPKLRTLKKQF